MVIYERDLLVYSKTNSIYKIFAVKKKDGDKPFWQLEFLMKGSKERALLVNALNSPRKFPRLNNLVTILNKWCPNMRNITLDLQSNELENKDKGANLNEKQ